MGCAGCGPPSPSGGGSVTKHTPGCWRMQWPVQEQLVQSVANAETLRADEVLSAPGLRADGERGSVLCGLPGWFSGKASRTFLSQKSLNSEEDIRVGWCLPFRSSQAGGRDGPD